MDSLTAQELRIWNYVKFQDDQTIFKIIEISENGLGVENENESTWIELENFEPIPLTAEWLLKFGFVKSYFDDIPYFEKGILTIDGCFFDIELMDSSKLNIKHVHQLQNLYFALTGTELKA